MFSPSDLQIRGSKIHGLGIYALKGIPAGTVLLEYIGKLLSKEEYTKLPDKTFCFAVDEELTLDGAQAKWNPAGFFNHSCEPNCASRCIEGKVWIITKRNITPGEELTFNYGYTPENLRQHPCRCGASGCVGYIVAEELFPMLKQLRESEAQKVLPRP